MRSLIFYTAKLFGRKDIVIDYSYDGITPVNTIRTITQYAFLGAYYIDNIKTEKGFKNLHSGYSLYKSMKQALDVRDDKLSNELADKKYFEVVR